MVDVGLRLHQVDGLEDEPISPDNLKSVGDGRLRVCGADEEEIAFLRGRRVELNALTTEQLVNLIEGALAENNVTKIVPSDKDLGNAWRAAKAHAEVAEAVEEANKRAERWSQADAPEALADQIRELLEEHPTMPWHAALRRIAGSAP